MQPLPVLDGPPSPRRLPSWLKRSLPHGNENFFTHNLLRELRLETVCENARCPNRPECYARRTATFMILGNVCTRPCGFCSVPRGVPEIVAPHARKVLENGWLKPTKRIFNNAKITDHNAIIPTDQVPRNLDEAQMRIFDMVARRFVAVFHPAAQFEVTTRITRVEGEAFKTEGRVIKDPGWLAVYGRQATNEQQSDSLVDIVPG